MNERYYVVSEEELNRLVEDAIENYVNPDQRERGRLREAEAACRAREVKKLHLPTIEGELYLWKGVEK